jgi:hypothetical protein
MQNALNIAPRRVNFETEQTTKVISPKPTINPISNDDITNCERVFRITKKLTIKPTLQTDNIGKERTFQCTIPLSKKN